MKSIELICINWGIFDDALKVTQWCMNQFPRFQKATIFHPDCMEGTHNNVRSVKSFSSSQHLCMLLEMPRYLTCDFAMSIQWDGFIVRPDLWDERFLDYDYIAPPWPLTNIINPDHRVGSGGFCLFSKRLAEYWVDHGDSSIPNDWERGAVNRDKYEKAGFTFAPVDLALKFGKECQLCDIDYPEGASYGFHGFQYHERREQYRQLVYGDQSFITNPLLNWQPPSPEIRESGVPN